MTTLNKASLGFIPQRTPLSVSVLGLLSAEAAENIASGGGGKIVYIDLGVWQGRDPEKLKKLREEYRRKKRNKAAFLMLNLG